MTLIQRLLVGVLSFGILVFTLELIRRRKLREEYSILWIMTAVVMLAFPVFPDVLYLVSKFFSFHYLTTVILCAFLFLLLIVLHYSTVISQLSDRETELAQRLAILEWKQAQNQFQATATAGEYEQRN